MAAVRSGGGVSGGHIDYSPALLVSFPDVVFQEDERIVGFEINITEGQVVAVNYIPDDWSVDVRLGYSRRPTISGSVSHGTGALDSVEPLRSFVTVCAEGDKDLPFNVEGTLVFTNDFVSTRERKFGMGELLLQKVSGESNTASPTPKEGAAER